MDGSLKDELINRLEKSGALEGAQSGFKAPSSLDLKEFIDSQGWTAREVSNITGCNYNEAKGESSTLRGWLKGDRAIPFAAWRLLLLKGNLISINDI